MMFEGVVAHNPFPSPEDAFAEVRREEMRRKVMLPDDNLSPAGSDVYALVTNKSSNQPQRHGKRPWCDHCNHPGHTKDKC